MLKKAVVNIADALSSQTRWRKIRPRNDTARVVKLVDTRDLKSLAFRKGRTGSIPVSGTINVIFRAPRASACPQKPGQRATRCARHVEYAQWFV